VFEGVLKLSSSESSKVIFLLYLGFEVS
jgi:hypothetical protein